MPRTRRAGADIAIEFAQPHAGVVGAFKLGLQALQAGRDASLACARSMSLRAASAMRVTSSSIMRRMRLACDAISTTAGWRLPEGGVISPSRRAFSPSCVRSAVCRGADRLADGAGVGATRWRLHDHVVARRHNMKPASPAGRRCSPRRARMRPTWASGSSTISTTSRTGRSGSTSRSWRARCCIAKVVPQRVLSGETPPLPPVRTPPQTSAQHPPPRFSRCGAVLISANQ